jgi:hydroxymethylpyrimidine/phosphomethylpyrimidine kinase
LLKLGTTKELITAGTKNILVTGTDHPQPDEDSSLVHHLLTERNGATSSFTDQRLPYTYHGSGCTLAAATACGLAFDKDIGEAIRDGLEYSWRSLKNGFKPGAGQHFPRRIQHKHLK